MGNMIEAEVTIKGTRPMFWHRFGPDSMPLDKQERTGVAGNDPEEWRKTVMATKDGQLYIEGTYVFGSLREGAKHTKNNRATLQKPVVACLQIVSDRVLVDRYFPGFPNGHAFDAKQAEPPPQDSDLPVYLDVRGVVNPNTRSRNVRYRVAASAGWQCQFKILWDKTIVSRDQMKQVIIDAGKLVGLGNGRSIGMGRFEVLDFAVSET